jgi:hypothetical protein
MPVTKSRKYRINAGALQERKPQGEDVASKEKETHSRNSKK